MNFDSGSSYLQGDLQLQHFIEVQSQRQKFQLLVHGLTDQCWDLCMDKPSTRLDSKTETCLVNCVQRFIDTTNFIVNRLEKTSQATLASSEFTSD